MNNYLFETCSGYLSHYLTNHYTASAIITSIGVMIAEAV